MFTLDIGLLYKSVGRLALIYMGRVLAHVRTKQMKASEIIMAHLASPARLTLSINADRANTMFRPCQVLTRKPTPRELFSLIHRITAYDRTRPHKSASLTISPAKSTLFSSPGGKQNPRDPDPTSSPISSAQIRTLAPGPHGSESRSVLGPATSPHNTTWSTAPPRLALPPPLAFHLLTTRGTDQATAARAGDPLRPREPDPKPLVGSPGI